VARYRFLPAAPHASEELRTYIAEHSVRQEADGRFGYAFDPRWFGIPPESRAVLEEIHCPTLVMRGGESDLLSREGARAVADRLADARWVEIAAAGHHIQLDRPDAFISELQIFMAEVADRSEPPDDARSSLGPAAEKLG
jgi:pimeloyl-ACP methyl ester carboxylesterase